MKYILMKIIKKRLRAFSQKPQKTKEKEDEIVSNF